MTTIRLTNTRTRTKEVFTPIDPQNVRMYVCGPTVYDRAHLGNARAAVVFDVLARLLRHVYPDAVTYVRNITDVDDKINARAAETGRPIRDITEETVGWYLDDMDALGVARPDHSPRATEYIPQMVAMIEELITGGHAYAAEGHVLFSVSSYKDYGKLSGRSVDDMIAGARVEVAPYKRDPMDFVLWKPAGDGPGWESPWGEGRPGWHIECSAMARELLGEVFDIHGGGMDLQFPHHENEIAQSNCAHGTEMMARYWVHNEMLQVEGRKMSKSLGNFFTVRDLLDKGYPGEVIRFVLLMSQYNKPMDWTEKKAEEATATLRQWRKLAAAAEAGPGADAEMIDLLADDLNTPGAIARLHAMAKEIATNPQKDCHVEKAVFAASARVLGLLDEGLGGWDQVDLSAYAERLSALRAAAMESKDFGPVDALKAALTAAGVTVQMSKAGVELSPGAGFDAAKLEGL